MKAITLYQPWASLIALGKKNIETRSWNTYYRGPLAIHAGKGTTSESRNIAELAGLKLSELPRGVIVAVADIVHVDKVQLHNLPMFSERLWGDYSPGRFMWYLTNAKPLKEPIPARGLQGIWEWDHFPHICPLCHGRGECQTCNGAGFVK